jgi:hypothetical protein
MTAANILTASDAVAGSLAPVRDLKFRIHPTVPVPSCARITARTLAHVTIFLDLRSSRHPERIHFQRWQCINIRRSSRIVVVDAVLVAEFLDLLEVNRIAGRAGTPPHPPADNPGDAGRQPSGSCWR